MGSRARGVGRHCWKGNTRKEEASLRRIYKVHPTTKEDELWKGICLIDISLVPLRNGMSDELEKIKGNVCPSVACRTHVENYQVKEPNGLGLRRVPNRIPIRRDKPPLGSIQVAE